MMCDEKQNHRGIWHAIRMFEYSAVKCIIHLNFRSEALNNDYS